MDLKKINRLILKDMMKNGWYKGKKYVYKKPLPDDINNGNCENWAILAQKVYGGELFWLDDIGHCVLKVNNKYYDSCCLNGTTRLNDFIERKLCIIHLK